MSSIINLLRMHGKDIKFDWDNNHDVYKVYRGTGRMEFDKYELNNIHYWPLLTSTSKS